MYLLNIHMKDYRRNVFTKNYTYTSISFLKDIVNLFWKFLDEIANTVPNKQP